MAAPSWAKIIDSVLTLFSSLMNVMRSSFSPVPRLRRSLINSAESSYGHSVLTAFSTSLMYAPRLPSWIAVRR